MNKQNLPKIQDLYDENIELREKENELNVILNQPPKKDWIKTNKHTGIRYLPIERVEWLLTNIFLKYRVDIREIKLIGNSVNAIIKLWYKNPIDGSWDYQSGTGAQPLQTDGGAGATDFNKLKSDAVQKGSPAAVSYATKNAAARLGKIFGRDLTRSDQIGYDSMHGRFRSEFDKLKDEIIDKLDQMDQNNYDTSGYRKEIDAARGNNNLTKEFLNELKTRIDNEMA